MIYSHTLHKKRLFIKKKKDTIDDYIYIYIYNYVYIKGNAARTNVNRVTNFDVPYSNVKLLHYIISSVLIKMNFFVLHLLVEED